MLDELISDYSIPRNIRKNIPFSKYQELLDRLKERGLVDITLDGNKNSINLTDKGREFIEQYRNIECFHD